MQLDTVNVAGNASAIVGGPSLTNKGSGNVAYEVDGATVTGGAGGNPFARQNSGTNMYFDFSTLENVEVATGGSTLEQQNSGVTINVVTKRGTNQFKGAARFLYASAAWQSSNTPQESLDQGLQTTSTRYIREYGGDLGGPIVQDRVWLWAAGSRQDISLNPATFSKDEVPYPQTTTLEPWSAKLNAQISNANSAALYYLRSNRLEYGVGTAPDRPPETRTNDVIPTDFYKIEDSNVFASDLFGSVFASYQSGNSSSIPIGGLDKEWRFYDYSFHNTNPYTYSKEPQKQANVQVSKFFNTGRINHELKLGFNYRQQISDSTEGLPGDQNVAGSFGTFTTDDQPGITLLSRGVRRIFERRYSSGTSRRHAHRGQSHVCGRAALRPAAGEEPSGHVVREHDVRESLHELRSRRGVIPRSAGGEVPRHEGLADPVHELAAPGLGDLRARREEEPRCCGPRTRGLRTSSATSPTAERNAGRERLLLQLDRPEPRPRRPAQRGPVQRGRPGLPQWHRSGLLRIRPAELQRA